MNRIFVFILLVFSVLAVAAQPDNVNSDMLMVSSNKTSSLIFPQIIKSVDIGSDDLIVQKVAGAENILQVKAVKKDFDETNLTIVTADGKLYVFTVKYMNDPTRPVINVDSTGSIYQAVAARKRTVYGILDEKYDMILRLKGLFIQNQIFYFQLELDNLSNISYLTDMLRFYIKDLKQGKRIATQELDQVPLFLYGNTGIVNGQSRQTIVAALPQFTIPEKKMFYVQVTERNGGRNLVLRISNRKIVRAAKL